MTAPHACAAPVSHERWVSYWANDLPADEVTAIDDQLFACDACAAEGQRTSNIVQAFRSMIPPVLSTDQAAALRGRGPVIRENDFSPGVRTSVLFDRDAELLIHHLRGLELDDAERVEVIIRSESHGTLFEEPFAPFDRGRGEVLIACQRHFAALPPDVAFDVRVYRTGAAAPSMSTYLIPHLFPD